MKHIGCSYEYFRSWANFNHRKQAKKLVLGKASALFFFLFFNESKIKIYKLLDPFSNFMSRMNDP